MNRVTVAFTLVLALTACGGGSGASAPRPQEGLYLGPGTFTLDSNILPRYFSQIVLEDGETWISDSRASRANDNPLFFSMGKFSFQDRVDRPVGMLLPRFTSAAALTTVMGNAIGTSSVSFSLLSSDLDKSTIAYVEHPVGNSFGRKLVTPETGYDYNKPATANDIVGSWTDHIFEFCPSKKTLIVGSTGAFTGTSTKDGCLITGNVVPRPSRKNVFNLNLNLEGCSNAGEYAGIAYSYRDFSPFGSGINTPIFRMLAQSKDKSKLASLDFKNDPRDSRTDNLAGCSP